MRRWTFIPLMLLLILGANAKSHAWVFVQDYRDTGWRNYAYQAGEAGFCGTAGFVVSNVVDNSAFSELLLDNLSHGGGLDNSDFELGNYSGYNLWGDSYAEITGTVTATSGNVYSPTRGENLSRQCGMAPGADTGAFRNAHRQTGTIGSILETPISLPPGSRFTFDWAFLAGDRKPWNDFALFYLKDAEGKIVFVKGLAQIGPIPVPPAIFLLGSRWLDRLVGERLAWPGQSAQRFLASLNNLGSKPGRRRG